MSGTYLFGLDSMRYSLNIVVRYHFNCIALSERDAEEIGEQLILPQRWFPSLMSPTIHISQSHTFVHLVTRGLVYGQSVSIIGFFTFRMIRDSWTSVLVMYLRQYELVSLSGPHLWSVS